MNFVICGNKLTGLQTKYCSPECSKKGIAKRTIRNCKCMVCGKGFQHKHYKKICSDKCKKEYENNKEKYDGGKRKNTFDENVRKARDLGLSYGKYMAMYGGAK